MTRNNKQNIANIRYGTTHKILISLQLTLTDRLYVVLIWLTRGLGFGLINNANFGLSFGVIMFVFLCHILLSGVSGHKLYLKLS